MLGHAGAARDRLSEPLGLAARRSSSAARSAHSLFVDALHRIERSATEMHESEDEDAMLKVLVCDAVVSKSRQEIPLNRRNHLFCPCPGGPYARRSDDRLKSGLNLTDEVVAEPGGALLVPIGGLDDLELRVRVNFGASLLLIHSG
jgi:hypothetical protein